MRIRLIYAYFEKFERYGTKDKKVGQTYEISSIYTAPKDMSFKNIISVISYLSDKVEKENNYNPGSRESVNEVDRILDNFGFKREKSEVLAGHYHMVSDYNKRKIGIIPQAQHIDKVIDLFTIGGDFKLFKKTELYKSYFDWYIKNVTKQDFDKIYQNLEKNKEQNEKTL